MGHLIFFENETTGDITDTITQVTGDAELYSREIRRDFNSTDEVVLFMNCADDDESTPTIAVYISLYFGSGWSDWIEIEPASEVAKKIKIDFYGKSWWIKNKGVKFKIVKSGAGAVTHSNARLI